MQIDIELLGPLVDYLPVSAKGEITIATKDNATIADVLKILKIKHKVIVLWSSNTGSSIFSKTDAKYGGPEYETLATFGSYCGIGDMDAIIYANALCNMYGMDTISCGATIAWALECWENGKITAEDTGGIEMTYGNAEAMVRMTELIAKREGFGKILAEGSKKAAEISGRGSCGFSASRQALRTNGCCRHRSPPRRGCS